MSNSTFVDDAVFRLASALSREDQKAFEEAARAAINKLVPEALGPGSVNRILRPIWRSFFHPPEPEENMRLTRWGQERPRSGRLIEHGSDRSRCGRHPRPTQFRGQNFRSRGALARALSPLCGDRDESAIAMMLIKLGDDAEAVIAYYAAKSRPKALVEA